MNDELTGTLVLVNPSTQEYPVSRQGMIGLVTAEDLANDIIYVGFNMGEQTRYTSDALMVLKKPSIIYADMMRNATKIGTADFKELFRVCLLLDSGLMKDKRSAIETARHNQVIREYTMIPLSEVFGIRQMRQLQTVSF